MTKEEITKTVPIQTFFVNKEPTCALNFEKGQFCIFLRTRKFGTLDVCALNTQNKPSLQRASNGFLVPDPMCCLTHQQCL
jgi:hypothetical protein